MASPVPLLDLIDAFLREFPMGESYFGRRAVDNSQLIPRLRAGRPVHADTDRAVRAWIASRRARAKRLRRQPTGRQGASA